ncbi:hypothetical protein [Wukongibacter sp. M2B1]|uniref:hypothetical protein n=1 Tax=Wukongibacter sp. M2B1 TaxID=3088895 RepID=UPI003D790AE8
MEQEILALKRAIIELERNKSINDDNTVIKNIDKIIYICEKIKEDFQKQDESVYKDVRCAKINTIKFIYKPLRVKNYFEGDYIVRFAEDRSRDLKDAKALDVHNEFWIQHKTIKGTIFGSVPKELLKEKELKSLLMSGWKEAEVDILEIKDCFDDIREIIKFCENRFSNYILIQEELTKSHLILNYKI